MRRDEVVRQLRALPGLRREVRLLELELERLRDQLESVENALAVLSEEERDIIGTMLINPIPLACDAMCEKLMIERSAVYRRRDKALQKLENCLPELRDKSGTTKVPR